MLPSSVPGFFKQKNENYDVLYCILSRNAGSSNGGLEHFSDDPNIEADADGAPKISSISKMNNDSNVMMPGIQNSFLNPYSLKPKNNKDKSYCDQCDKWISKYYLKEHMSRIHKIEYEIENPNASGVEYYGDYEGQDDEYDPDIICPEMLEPIVQVESVLEDGEEEGEEDDEEYFNPADYVDTDLVDHGDSGPEMNEEEHNSENSDDLILGL